MFSDGIPSLVMDFTIPNDIKSLLDDLDHFIEDVIRPIENEDDNIRSSIIVARMLEPTGSEMVFQTKSGNPCL